MPLIVVLPGLVLFGLNPEILLSPWEQVKPSADKGYVQLVQSLVPVGLEIPTTIANLIRATS